MADGESSGRGTIPSRVHAEFQPDRVCSLGSRYSQVNTTKIESTVRYLGIEVDDALAIAEQVDV